MTRIIAAILSLILSAPSWASCQSDVGATFKSQQPELAPHDTFGCFDCREINQFPQDIRNFMFNWGALGPYSTWPSTANGLGTYIFGYRLDEPITASNPFTGERSDTMAAPVCNAHGQCATATLQVVHNFMRINFARGWYLQFNTSIKEVRVNVHLPNGDIGSSGVYTASQMNSYRQQGYKLPIPASITPDVAADDACFNNLGQLRPPDSEMTPISTGGGPYGEGDDPYEHWWDEEEAYGGRVPELRCGIADVPGGTSTRTCGWFWF